jgi:nucleoside-diphosphate-sugar epimerase
VAENSLARKLMGWEPKVPLRDGVKLIFDRMLTSR